MTPTIPFIKRKFDEYNKLMFGGKLPDIPIKLSNARSFLGVCSYKKKRVGITGQTVNYDFVLRINTRIDLPQNVVEDTIIHEMIHYYIAYNQLKDTSAHGEIFRSIMQSINSKFGRNLSVSHKPTESQKLQARNGRKTWHVVAVVSFADGRTGVKVLPRIVQRITNYYNNILALKAISEIRLYMSDDTFFNRFPNSSALNVCVCDAAQIEEHVKNAERLVCNGDSIVREK